jgi:hypothetical protein
LFAAGCTHPLEIKKAPDALNSESLSDTVKLGFIPPEGAMLESVIEEIGYCRNVEGVYKNCTLDESKKLDYILGLSNSISTKASGQNFFITFPGFLIFAHAGIGYKYTVNVETKSKILNDDGTSANEMVVQTPYEIRYTSFARGAASSSGWYLPGWGITNIIPGAIFSSSFDNRGINDFYASAKESYKKIIAPEIISQINEYRVNPTSRNTIREVTPTAHLKGKTGNNWEASDDGNLMSFYSYKIEGRTLIPYKRKVVNINKSDKTLISIINKEERFSSGDQLDRILALAKSTKIIPVEAFSSAKIYVSKNGKLIALMDNEHSTYQLTQK